MSRIVESRGFSQKEANQTVPFPRDTLKQEGDIEQYLIRLRNRDAFPSFEELPDMIGAPALDAYSSWLSDLTSRDPTQRERGAFIHLDISADDLVYPINPHVGTKRQGTAEYGQGNRFIPLVRAHSHPDNTSFSPHDLIRAIGSDWFIAELLSTPEANYLLLRTYETEFDNINEAIKRMGYTSQEIHKAQKKMLKVLSSAVKSGEMPIEVANYIQGRYLQEEIREFGSDSLTYMLTFTVTIDVAERYKLGFYRSDRKGNFQRLDESVLQEIKKRQMMVIDRASEAMIRER